MAPLTRRHRQWRVGPSKVELDAHFTSARGSRRCPVRQTFDKVAPVMAAVTEAHVEASQPTEISVVSVGDLGPRFGLVASSRAPRRTASSSCSSARPSLRRSAIDRVVERDGRSVRIRDFGGQGPLLLLWHGAGCERKLSGTASSRCFDPYGSWRRTSRATGRSPRSDLSVADAVADTRAVLDELATEAPILVGHSIGGWIALHYAAVSPCHGLVCLDGPTNLDYAAMGITPEDPRDGWRTATSAGISRP